VRGDEDRTRFVIIMTQDATRVYLRFVVLFLIVGAILGILAAFSILLPDVFRTQPIPGYGRVVAAHRMLMVHGVLFFGVLGCAYALIPRMAGVTNGSRSLSTIIAWIGAIVVAIGALLILGGKGSGHEYSDLPPALAFLFWLFLIFTSVDIALILSRQKTLKLNPAQGFLFLAAVFPAVVYPFAIPGWWGDGLSESTRIWVTWRAIFTGVFLSGAIGVSLWMLGMNGRKLLIPAGAFTIGTGLLIVFSPFMGIVHEMDAPIWSGLRAFGAFSGAMSATGLLLVALSLWKSEKLNPAMLLLYGGLVGLVVTALQGLVLLIPPIYSAFHFTANTSGHAHIAMGSILLILLGGILMIAPRISGHRLVGGAKIRSGIAAIIAGMIILSVFMSSAGVVQAMSFSQGLDTSDWLPAFRWLFAGVIIGGILILTGAGIIGSSILQTINTRDKSRLVPGDVTDEPPEPAEIGDEWMEGGDA